jgi:hypothetical protein
MDYEMWKSSIFAPPAISVTKVLFLGKRRTCVFWGWKNELPDSFFSGFFQGHLRWNKHFSCDFWQWFQGSSFDRWINGSIGCGKQ